MMTGLAGCQTAAQPRAQEQAFPARAWLAACDGKDGWDDAGPPFHVFGNTYYVGTCGISAILVTGEAGHILIDGGTQAGGPLIAANVERLGFAMADVDILLFSHEHFDHVGGLAFLQRASGASVLASPAAAAVLASGTAAPEDPQAATLAPFAPIETGRTLRDGEIVRLGGLEITAHATPGHSPGAMSWTWRSCEAAQCRQIAYLDSLSAVSADTYRFTDHPALVAQFRASLDKAAALPCDIVLTPHPAASGMRDRIAAGDLAAGIDCQAYAAAAAGRLDARLAQEAAR